MFRYLKTYLQFGKHFCGVEHSSKNGVDILYASILIKTKKEVTIENSFSSKSIKRIAKKLPNNQHIHLVINNEQVLTKSLKKDITDGLKLVNQAFPNINISDFYFEIIPQKNTMFVSICRKEYVDTLIETYYENKIYIVSFSLGNSILSNMISYIENTVIFTSNAVIYTNNHVIEKMDFVEETEEQSYEINGLNASSSYILSFSGALSNILNNYIAIISYQEKKNALLNTFKQVHFFSQFFKNRARFYYGNFTGKLFVF